MNPPWKAAFLALISGAACLAQTISGSVATIAGDPVKGATLRLIRQRPGPGEEIYSVLSDAKGNFTFEDMAAGRYNVCAEKPGYLQGCQTNQFDLAAGQVLTGIDVQMTPQAVISGKITDENGDPYPNLQVSAVQWSYAGGQKSLRSMDPRFGGPPRPGVSNVEGLFTIGDLRAGSYYIQVEPRPPDQRNMPQQSPQEAYLVTYYPGVSDPSKAVEVQVPAAGAIRDLEIRMRKAHAYRVQGKLTGVPNGAVVTVELASNRDSSNRRSAMVRDGIFDFEGVLPGEYVVRATASTAPATPGITPPGQTPRVARQAVTVGASDINDLLVPLGRLGDVTGTVTIDGPLPPRQRPPALPVVRLIALEPGTYETNPHANGDGTFTISGIMPASYRIDDRNWPAGFYVKSIRLAGREVTNKPLDLTSGGAAILNVVLSPNAADVSGVMRGADGLPLPSTLVTLWAPGVPAEGQLDFVRFTRTNARGQFMLSNLPPGEYLVAAWQEDNRDLETAPAFRIGFESQAATVKVQEGSHANVEAPLIGHDAIAAQVARLQ